VSGFSNLNNLLVNNNATFISSVNISGFTTLNNKTTILSSLNVSGFTTLNNNTNINASLYISGLNVLQTLNNHTTDLSILFGSNVDVLQTLNNYSTDLSILFEDVLNTTQIVNNHTTDLSTLYNLRDDNPNALITLEDDVTAIHGILPNSEIQFKTVSSIIDCFTKIDKYGILNIYHPPNVLLPNRTPGFWVVHDELESLQKQAIIDMAKFALHDLELDRIGAIATGAAGVASGAAAGVGLLVAEGLLTGGEIGSLKTKTDTTNNKLNNLSTNTTLEISNLNATSSTLFTNLNSLSTNTTLLINNLNTTSSSFLELIMDIQLKYQI
jgi:hypothetical protein